MNFGGFGFDNQFGFTAASQTGGAGAVPSELFPDPTLADVADETNGWAFTGTAGPTGGTGPGITCDDAENATANLVGTDGAALKAALTPASSYSVTLTPANFISASTPSTVALRNGTPVEFLFSGNTPVTHTLVAGSSTDNAEAFMAVFNNGFDITGISVTAV